MCDCRGEGESINLNREDQLVDELGESYLAPSYTLPSSKPYINACSLW